MKALSGAKHSARIEVLVNPFITAYQIAALSSGEFVGLVADNPDEKIRLKMFHAEIINDADKLNEDVLRYKNIPVVSNVTRQQVLDN
jgi:hypothetical protein